MKHIPAVVALCITLFWTSSANAACISEAQCDAENCGQMDTCADEIDVTGAIDMTRAAPDNISPMLVQNDLLSESPVAAAVADARCREVEICGTTQLVCD
jgi:hypothetical protein